MGTSVRSSSLHQTIFIDTDDLHSICPGRHLADVNIWLAIVRILSVFTITKAKDADGNTIEPDVKWGTGLVRCVCIRADRVVSGHRKTDT